MNLSGVLNGVVNVANAAGTISSAVGSMINTWNYASGQYIPPNPKLPGGATFGINTPPSQSGGGTSTNTIVIIIGVVIAVFVFFGKKIFK